MELWQRRRWRYLLNLIDHLPQNSYFHQAVSLDEEHAAMLAAAGAFEHKDGEASWSPPIATYSPEVEAAWTIVNELRALRHTMIAMKSKTPPAPPEMIPRPKTAFDKYASNSNETRAKKHRELAARVLPHKRAQLLGE